MPIYEYECGRCGKTSSLMEKMGQWNLFWRRRCVHCGSRKLKRVYSGFSTSRKQSMGELIDEMRKLGPVNFVPRPPNYGPPPGGCPFEKEGKEKESPP